MSTTHHSAEYHRAVARRIKNSRHLAALALAEVAEAHCRRVGATVADVAAMDQAHWLMLNTLAGRTRPPSEETKQAALAILAQHLAPACA
jgi:hypothetical protein